MSNRLASTFARLRAEKRPGLVTYTTAGDPDLPRSAEILKALDRAGADVLEVGVPFSDPLADGPVIQRATERAIAAGRQPARVAGDDRRRCGRTIKAPIVIFSYANPMLRLGLDAFARQAADAGVDGVLALDLPIEEAGELPRDAGGGRHRHDLSAQPDDDRCADQDGGGAGQRISLRHLAARRHRRARRGGGRRAKRWCGGSARTRRCRSRSGSGSRRPEQVAEVCAYADAAVVGSALVSVIAEASAGPISLAGSSNTCGG